MQPLEDAAAGALLPALDHDLAVDRVEGGDEALARQLREELGLGRGAKDDLGRALVEPVDRAGEIADAAADAAACELEELIDDEAVVALAHGAVEVDDRDLADDAEAARDGQRVAGVDLERLAADELDRRAALEIDRRHDHD